jgi:hypothetical protein
MVLSKSELGPEMGIKRAIFLRKSNLLILLGEICEAESREL